MGLTDDDDDILVYDWHGDRVTVTCSGSECDEWTAEDMTAEDASAHAAKHLLMHAEVRREHRKYWGEPGEPMPLRTEVFVCSKCGLTVTDLTLDEAAKVADVHEELVHRLGLFIEEPVKDERWVAETLDPDGEPLQVLVERWPDSTVTVSFRRQSSHTWGPPAFAVPR